MAKNDSSDLLLRQWTAVGRDKMPIDRFHRARTRHGQHGNRRPPGPRELRDGSCWSGISGMAFRHAWLAAYGSFDNRANNSPTRHWNPRSTPLPVSVSFSVNTRISSIER